MSSVSDASPQTRSGIDLGGVSRWLAVALGIMSAVLLARDGFKISLNEYLDAIISAYDDTVTDIVLVVFEPSIKALFVNLRKWLDLDLHLLPHWKHAFVLLRLFCSVRLRARIGNPVPRGGIIRSVQAIGRWAWTLFAALLGGALAGTVPLEQPALLWWATSAYFLMLTGDELIDARYRLAYRGALSMIVAFLCCMAFAAMAISGSALPAATAHPPLFLWSVAAALVYLSAYYDGRRGSTETTVGLAFVAIVLALGLLPASEWLPFETSTSPGLAHLAMFIGVITALHLVPDIVIVLRSKFPFDFFLESRELRTAIDVFSVLGGAALIAYLAHMFA